MILDTNALSAIAEGDPRAAQLAAAARQIAIPVIALGEYRFGIAQSRRRREYEIWLGDLLALSRTLDVDEATTTFYAALRRELKEAGTPIPGNDAWIAALCRQHAFPLLSRDQHFDLVRGIERVAW